MAFPTTVTIIPTNGSGYTWDGAGFAWASQDGAKSWDTAYPISYALNVREGWSTNEGTARQYTLNPRESCHMAEFWSQVFAHVIYESWRTTEVWTDIWNPMLRIFEGWLMAEALSKAVTIPKSESWATAEAATRAHLLNPQEGWQTSEAWLQQYLLSPEEGWAMAELATWEVSRTLFESMSVAENQPVWNAIKAIQEAWANGETMAHVWQDFLTFVEGWVTTETPKNSVTRPLSESWRTADGLTNASQKGVQETCHFSDSLNTQTAFRRTFAEALHLVDSLSSAQIMAILEALNIDDAYLRNANAVISDLAFSSDDFTLDEFLNAISTPVSYGPFTDFIPGELEFQKALVALVLAGPLTTGRPQVTEWTLTVDVPDRTDSGTLSIPAANTFVPFKVRFFAPPEVTVQLRGGSTGTPDITGITDAGFYLQINGAGGQLVVGDVVWSAVGY